MSVLTGRRQQIISGESEPTAQEVDDSALLNSALLKSPAVKARLEGAASGAEPAGLPGFWPAALRACSEQGHAKLFTEKDWEVLEYLTEVKVDAWSPFGANDDEWTPPGVNKMLEGLGRDGDDAQMAQLAMARESMEMARESMNAESDGEMNGLAITLTFAPNPYLEPNSLELVMRCHHHGMGMSELAEVLPPSGPSFKEGMDPRVKKAIKTQRKKGRSPMKSTVLKPTYSFFGLFQVADADEQEYDDDGAAGSDLDEKHTAVFDLFTEQLVPMASHFYLVHHGLLPHFEEGDDDYGEGEWDDLEGPEFDDLPDADFADFEGEKPKKGQKPKRIGS